MSTEQQTPEEQKSAMDEQERQRGLGEYVREAWSQALVAVSATEDEVQKILSRVTGWVDVGPDEARRLGAELTEKLRGERAELEQTLQTAVQKALAPFRLPSREDVAELVARVDRLEERLKRVAERRSA